MNKQILTKQKQKGITLIALVITIIVLLILAGVSIAMLTGENGILTQAQEAKDKSERAEIIEAAKLAYNAVTIEKLGVADASTMRDLTIIELKKQGYDVKTITTTTEKITEINLSNEELTLNVGDADAVVTITYQGENTSDSKYYVLVSNEYYELTINPGSVTLAETPTDVESLETEVKDNIEVTSTDTTETTIAIETVGETITITPVGAGTATIRVTNGSIAKECIVTVEDNTPTAITINGEDSVEVYSTMTLTAEFDKGEGTIEWTSSNPEVATIDDNGVVTGVCCETEITTTITARYADNNQIAATKQITVTPEYVGECWKSSQRTDAYYYGASSYCNEGIASGTYCSECGGKEVSIDQEVYMPQPYVCYNPECEYYITNGINYQEFPFELTNDGSCPYCDANMLSAVQIDYVLSCGHCYQLGDLTGQYHIDIHEIDCQYCDGGKTYDYGKGIIEPLQPW